ncbi:hypothetical protein PsorP6_017046 [Peronosclerospora sorghi]|uniref:Uncharacterized protein n=1 Tax=Peronosclerospora sorghi TaxID=230839 RepID=A0ACC0WD68_9STRA|nr:hypothetical protein PsorP6_017046 [Peronosclerospora sorghi]
MGPRIRTAFVRAFATAHAPSSSLTHVNRAGIPHMVDISSKHPTRRSATARSTIRLPPAVLHALQQHESAHLMGPKGCISTTAILAGVQGAKQTSTLLPFCHPLPLEHCHVTLDVLPPDRIVIECHVCVTHKTGVEMEALTGASVAALCVYDMCKALSHEIVIETTHLVEKTGGKRDFTKNKLQSTSSSEV